MESGSDAEDLGRPSFARMANDSETFHLDLSRASVARAYAYFLDVGGKDSLAHDRALGEAVLEVVPGARVWARENRRFLGRAVRYLADRGVRQFIDLGSGGPAPENLHGVAQRVAPEARFVYADADPVVLSHLRALLAARTVRVIEADLREPEKIISHPDLVSFIDWSEPVGFVLGAVLHCLTDETDPYGIVQTLSDVMAPGSYLVVSHVDDTEETRKVAALYAEYGLSGQVRTAGEIARFFDRLQLVEPGLVRLPAWRPASLSAPEGAVPLLGGVAQKRNIVPLPGGAGSADMTIGVR